MKPTLESLDTQFSSLIAKPLPPVSSAVTPVTDELDKVADSPAAAALPVAIAPPPPVQKTDFASKGYHLDVTAAPGEVVAAAKLLLDHGFALEAITGVDWIADGAMEVVYDYFHPEVTLRVVVRSRIPRDKPEIPTLAGVFSGADWHERETHDFFDINFVGNPNLTVPFLLAEDVDFHPLRKDFNP